MDFRVANVPYGILGCDVLSCHSFHVDVKNRCLIDPEGSMFNDSTSLDPDSTIESSVTQIESPLDCEHKLLAFAPSTLHTRMDDITEPKLYFELKPTEIGQNVTKPKLDSKPCDRQSADLASPSLMNVLHSDIDSSGDFEVNRVTSQSGNENVTKWQRNVTTLSFHQQKWFLARHLDARGVFFDTQTPYFPCRIRQPITTIH